MNDECPNVLHNVMLSWRVTRMLESLAGGEKRHFEELTYALFGYRDGVDALDPRPFWRVTALIEAMYDLKDGMCLWE